ncbi:MAG: hypothetical protein P1V81_09020 [Planctomycetota bacterium]|nr:hypothetical protein [Planctomycetota bacterium]
MPRAVKIVLVILALPALLFAGAILYGVYLGLTGQVARTEEPPQPAPIEAPSQADRPRVGSLAGLPSPLDAEAAKDWIEDQGLLRVVDGELVGDAEGFASIPLDDAVALHQALRRGQDKYQGLRLLTFAWLSHLPPEPRLAFANEVGIAFRPDGERFGRAYIGELCGMYFSQTNDPDSIFAQAVRRYCEVIDSDAVIQSLRDFNVIQADPSVDQWYLRVDQKMQDFDPDTLLAIRDAIDLFFGLGDRKYLRAQLADLAETKRGA